MEDYKELIKQMLLRDFSPQIAGELLTLSTAQILEMVQGVIPPAPITQHEIFEALQEAQFKYELFFLEEKPLYLWKLYKK